MGKPPRGTKGRSGTASGGGKGTSRDENSVASNIRRPLNSQDDPVDFNDNEQKSKSLLETIKEAKEFIAILVFFVGGVIWLYAAFATKRQVAGVRCLLGATIERIDNEAQAKNFQAEIVEHSVRLQQIQNSGKPILDIIVDVENTKQKIEDLKSKKILADGISKKASQRVLSGECEQ